MSIKKIHALVDFGFLASIAATASKGDYFDGGTVSLLWAPAIIAAAKFDGHRIARERESTDPRRAKSFFFERLIWSQNSMWAMN